MSVELLLKSKSTDNVLSARNTTTSAAHQSSASGGIASNERGGASFSAQNGHGDANYADVNEQAGLYAGDDRFTRQLHEYRQAKEKTLAKQLPDR